MPALLLDANLSYRLVSSLMHLFPGTLHVRDVGLERAQDTAVWAYARDHNLVVVSKDGDFRHLSLAGHAPPKLVWVRAGNQSTSDILRLLVHRADRINRFVQDSVETILVLS